MANELKEASDSLHTALERYLDICSIHSRSLEGNTSCRIPRELAGLIQEEFDSFKEYESRLGSAKLAITTARNRTFHLSPVNTLPPEVLVHIFQIIFEGGPCDIDYLAQVCSRWRSVAFGSHYLWSHIDYHPNAHGHFCPQLLDHARLHVTRSGRVPLEIHISASIGRDDVDEDLHHKAKFFFQATAPRMWALRVDLDLDEFAMFDNSADVYHHIISDLISGSTPGMLTKLKTLDGTFDDFIIPENDSEAGVGDRGLMLSTNRSELDQIFSSITVLQLQGLYPQWQSPTYHGLVDLRITPAYEGIKSLSEWELIAILKSSPELRILHFGYPISNRIEGNTSNSRVTLSRLEILQITSFQPGIPSHSFLKVHNILRLISPGSNPLHLSVRSHFVNQDEDIGDHSIEEIGTFLARARVARLYTSTHFLPEEFFIISSYLKVLILDRYNHILSPLLPIDHGNESPSPPPAIEFCYMLYSSLDLERFYSTVRRCSVQNLVIFKCRFYSNREEVSQEQVVKGLLRICPAVEFPSERPGMMAHRELFE
ncbi:hypothetical protein RSAG8_11950, partial [Rhizoctonia solani AG-8 WAC10335]